MMNEKEQIAEILRQRGVLLPGDAVDLRAFNKLVTEPWLYNKSIKYGFVSNPNLWDIDVNEPVKEQPIENQQVDETKEEIPVETTEEPAAEEVIEQQPETTEIEIVDEQPVENQQVEEVVEEVVETSVPKKKKSSAKK